MTAKQKLIALFGFVLLFSGVQAEASVIYRWSASQEGGQYCAEETPSGNVIQEAAQILCDKQQGSIYRWTMSEDGGQYCAKETPSGNVIQEAAQILCDKQQGSIYRWATSDDGQQYCAKETPSGNVIQEAAQILCEGGRQAGRPRYPQAPYYIPAGGGAYEPRGVPVPTPIKVVRPKPTPRPVVAPALPPLPARVPKQAVSYRWQDGSQSVCIGYDAQGSVTHMVAPSLCQ